MPSPSAVCERPEPVPERPVPIDLASPLPALGKPVVAELFGPARNLRLGKAALGHANRDLFRPWLPVIGNS